MQPLGRRGKRRHNLLCRASPGECCRERRESPSGPFHYFSIGRHLWFCLSRLPLQRRMVQRQIECSSNSLKTFSCDFSPVDFLLSDLGKCSRDAIVRSEQECLETNENIGLKKNWAEMKHERGRAKSPAHWTIADALTRVCEDEKRVVGPRLGCTRT